jgi:predicted DsbA family dithiol-disulfide isomerase
MIRLDIFSDPICPWCLIGKTLLDRALESRPDHPFAVAWHPFQLNPDMPREGVDRRAYLEAKFGGKAQAVEVYARVADAARNAGLEINFEAMERTPNTLDAHRLIHWAGLEGRQNAVVDALFRAYFREGRDIGDTAVLVEVAALAGMDAGVTARLLATEADRDDLIARDRDARQKGVSAVPTFLVAQQYVLSGAQPVALWQRAIDEISAEIGQTPDAAPPDGRPG